MQGTPVNHALFNGAFDLAAFRSISRVPIAMALCSSTRTATKVIYNLLFEEPTTVPFLSVATAQINEKKEVSNGC
jgi:hypothetical protein